MISISKSDKGEKNVTLRHYQIFVAVCDRLNMTAAAEALFMSQSAVSQAVAELERYYGVRLFERLSRKLYLTEGGEKLLGFARHIVGMNAEAESEMRALLGRGRIRLGASVTVGASVLPRLVSRFRRLFPNTAVEVCEDNTEKIEARILSDRTDLGLVEGKLMSPELAVTPFLDDELVLVCGAGHRFAAMEDVAPAELESEDFIVREKGSGTRRTFEEVMAAHGLEFREAWTCNNADTIKAAVEEGLGVTVISRRSVKAELETGALIEKPVGGLRFERRFKLVRHKNKYLTAPMKGFVDLCLSGEN